ncbi:hypothetical protein Tco_0686776 [Tanacetum coccineum]
MSDSKHSTVTYTSVSEDDSDIGSPGVDGPPIMPEDPYAYIMAAYEVPPSPDYIPGLEVPPSPDYIPGPKGPPSPDYVPGPEEPEQAPPSPVYLPYVPESVYPEQILDKLPKINFYPADRDDDDDEDEDEDEEEEEHPAPADSVPPVHRMTARISIRVLSNHITSFLREWSREDSCLNHPNTITTYPLSSPLPQIPSTPPNSPTYIEIPESCLPLWKRVRFASPTPSREVGESSAAGAARQDRPTIARDDPYSIAREDLYGFVDMVDVPPRCSTSRELDYDITDTWDDLEETTSMYGIMEDAQDDRSLLRARVNLLYRDRPVHRRLAVMIEREAKMAREAWGLSMDASDCTFRLAQSALISKLQSADHRRQGVIRELWAADHKRQQGPAKGPAQPDAPGEASSSS